MGKEIERKFLLKNENWRGLAEGILYRQAYLNDGNGPTVRVRIIGERGFLAIKGPTVNASRQEFEYEIPHEEAAEMLDTLAVTPVVEKRRYTIPHDKFIWEVDEFIGANQGLIFAEIELEDADQSFPLPSWVGEEVTDDPRYYNSNLARHPYTSWTEER